MLAMVASLITIIPVYLVCVNALKSEAQSSSMGVGLPTEIHLENFSTVIEKGKLVTSFINSMLYAGGAAILATLFAALAAFILSRQRTRVNRALYFFLIMGIALPINFFTLTKMMQVTHLINTHWHFDHTSGNEWLHSVGAKIIARQLGIVHVALDIFDASKNFDEPRVVIKE